jgi:hypothetical protein
MAMSKECMQPPVSRFSAWLVQTFTNFLFEVPSLYMLTEKAQGHARPLWNWPKEKRPEPEFLKILKCNSAECASAGFQFNFLDIFSDKIIMYRHFVQFSILLKFTEMNHFYQHTKTVSCRSPAVPVLSDL